MAERLHEPPTGRAEPGPPPAQPRTSDEVHLLLVREVQAVREQVVDLTGQLHAQQFRVLATERQHEHDLRELALLRLRARGRWLALTVLVATAFVAVAVRSLVARVTTADDLHLLASAAVAVAGLTGAFRALDAEQRARTTSHVRPIWKWREPVGRRTLPPVPDVVAMAPAQRRSWVARARAVRSVRAYRAVFGPDS